MELSNGVCIDLGHGGKDCGALGNDYKESMLVLDIGIELKKLLEARGIKHKFTRTTDIFLTLQERCNIANDFKADLFLSIHINSATNKSAFGTEAWVYKLKNNKNAIDLSTNITNDLTKLLNTKNRGVKENTKFTVLKNTKMPSIILEVDFISNESMEKNIKVNTRNIARVIYKNILKLYGLNDIENTSNNEIKYRVVIGAFNNKDNATKILEEAKRKGFTDSYIM